ncbi:MAG: penicillin-binding protein activator [Desulfuromonadales bacterium]
MAIRFLLLLVILCCAAPALGAERAESGMGSLQQGIELYRGGQPEEALNRLRAFVVRHGDSPLLPEAYLYLARIFLDTGRPDEALTYIERIAHERMLPEMRLIRGAALVATGQAQRGVEILLPLEKDLLGDADRRLRLQSLADGNAALGQSLQALFFLHRSLHLPGAVEEAGLQQAHLLLRDQLSDAELAEAAFMFGGAAIGEDARLQQALRAFGRGETAEARRLAAEVVRGGVPFPYRRDAVQLMQRLAGESWVERSIGVILPLNGRYATFGALVRRGMELAQQVHGETGVRFLFTDTDADAEKSAQAVSDLVINQRVMAIAGPLTGGAAAAAAARAQEEQVPLLTLSQREGLPELGSYVFRDCLTSRLQVQALVTYAMEVKKISSFGILYPENKLGREMTGLFAQEVISRGGQVTDRQGYAENATDFRHQVRLLQGRDPALPDVEPAPDEPPAAPPAFQALFIPDYADRIGLIAPQLVFYGLEDTQLLGINGWNSPELLRLAGNFLEGAVFVDGFFRYSPYPFVSEFVNLYFEKYGEEPSILEAQGFDVAGILLTALRDPGVRTRDDLRLALMNLRNYPGVTGATSFDLQGEAEKILFLLQVRNGDIVQIN